MGAGEDPGVAQSVLGVPEEARTETKQSEKPERLPMYPGTHVSMLTCGISGHIRYHQNTNKTEKVQRKIRMMTRNG